MCPACGHTKLAQLPSLLSWMIWELSTSAMNMQSIIEEHYKCSADWTGTRYISITLDWEYTQWKVHLSMPGYKDKALKQFQYHKPSTPQHSPFQRKEIKYGARNNTLSSHPQLLR
jgi:hypothetical protein